MEIDRHLGRRILQARSAIGRDQQDVASAIGTTLDEYKAMEAGVKRIDALYMARLSAELGQPLKWFFEGLPGQDPFNSIRIAKKSV